MFAILANYLDEDKGADVVETDEDGIYDMMSFLDAFNGDFKSNENAFDDSGAPILDRLNHIRQGCLDLYHSPRPLGCSGEILTEFFGNF